MGKNKKPAAPEAAPAVEQNSTAKTDPNQVAMTKHFLDNYQGMSPDSCVTALERIAKMVHDDRDACKHLNITEEHQKFANELVYTGMMTLVITEIVAKKSAFAITMNKANIDTVKRIASELGVTFDGNYLPAPTAEDADAVEVEMNASTIKVSKETKETIEKEETIKNDVPELDPTKFTSDEDVNKALNYILVSEPGAFAKFARTAALLRSYLLIKAGDNADEKKSVENLTHGELLNEVFKRVGSVPMILTGFSRCLYRETSQAASPVIAFAILRNASKNKTTNIPAADDKTLSDIVKVLVRYNAENAIADENKKIEKANADIELLSKDKKKNAKGIEDLKAKIETYKGNIEHMNDVIDHVYSPTDNLAKTFLEDIQDANSENYKLARKAFSMIAQSYYGPDTKELNQEVLRHNIQQMIGIITNLFRDPSNQLDGYSEANIASFKEDSKN